MSLLLCSVQVGQTASHGQASSLEHAAGQVHVVRARHGVAATVHPLASQAAITAMQNGGNAIDGAVAAALTLGVVDGHNSGIGGGCFMLIRTARGRVWAIDGRETAPAAATRDMFVRHGKVVPELSLTGPLAVGVPGALAAYDWAVSHLGRLSLREPLEAAADLAEHGFALNETYANRLRASAALLKRFPGSRKIFLHPDGSPYRRGEILRQPDLARTYRAIAWNGAQWFYRGAFAQMVAAWMKDHGGLITAADFASYRARLREPVVSTFRGHRIVGFPPPSSGGVHVAQILNMLEQFDLKSVNAADRVHVIAEAMKLAFADRAFWLGDPDFARVPRGLIDKSYAARLSKRIRLDRVLPVASHGVPPQATKDWFGKHTTHFSVADHEGNWVACTATINTSFGSKVVVPGTGVILNNEMDDFAAQPGVPNVYGLIGAEANAVAPGKRPLSSMSPTIVLKDGQPVLALGAAGGPTIITQVLLTLVNVIDLGMPLPKALAQARFHHQWRPDELRVEQRLGKEIITELRRRGHHVVEVKALGATQAVGYDPHLAEFIGATDPRGEGQPAGF